MTCEGCVFNKHISDSAFSINITIIHACSNICGKCVRNPNNEFSCIHEDLYMTARKRGV